MLQGETEMALSVWDVWFEAERLEFSISPQTVMQSFQPKTYSSKSPRGSGQGECMSEFGEERGLLVKLHSMIMDVSR